MNGGCSSTSGEICDGTSVLKMASYQLSVELAVTDPTSQWANELFTTPQRRSGTNQIVVSVEVPSGTHNHVELMVFNCPQLGIYAPCVIVYVADSLT